jgi:hypothetical protein
MIYARTDQSVFYGFVRRRDACLNHSVITAISLFGCDRPNALTREEIENGCIAIYCIFTRQSPLNLKAVIAV